jgi:hypothetical protein
MAPNPKPGQKTPPLPDWAPTRDPKRNAEIYREVDAEFRQEEEARKAHLAKLKAMEGTLLDRRQRCAGALDILDADWRAQKNNWQNTIIDLSGVYLDAWTNFSKAFTQGNKDSAKMWTITALALTTITKGGLAGFATFVGQKWLTSDADRIIVSGVSAAVQHGLSGIIALPPDNLVMSNTTADIPSPPHYQGELIKQLNRIDNEYLAWLKTMRTLINNLPLEKFEFYDPSVLAIEIKTFLKSKDKEFNSTPFANPVVKSAMQTELEKSMWIQWFIAYLPTADGAALSSSWWGTRGRMPEFMINKLGELQLIDTDGRYSDDDVLKLASPPNGRMPRQIIQKALLRAKTYRPLRKFG